MQGSFTYQNKPLMYLTALLFIVAFLIEINTIPNIVIFLVLVLVYILLEWYFMNLRGNFKTTSTGVVFRFAFSSRNIPFSEIEYADCEVKQSVLMRGMSVSYRAELIIKTKSETFTVDDAFEVSTDDVLNDRKAYEEKLAAHQFTRLAEYINLQIPEGQLKRKI